MGKTFFWSILSLVLIAATFLLTRHLHNSSGKLSQKPPIAEGLLPDGSKLRILEAGVGEVTLGTAASKAKGWFTLNNHSSIGGILGRCDYAYKISKSGDEVQQTRFYRLGSGDLVLAVDLLDIAGKPTFAELTGGWGKLNQNGFGNHFPFSPKLNDLDPVQKIIDGESRNPPQLLLQLQNSSGKWVNGFGPVTLCDPEFNPDLFSIVIFSGWEPTATDLNLRAIVPGAAPITFHIPSPSLPKPSPPLKPLPLPLVKLSNDYRLTIESSEVRKMGDFGLGLDIEANLEPQGLAQKFRSEFPDTYSPINLGEMTLITDKGCSSNKTLIYEGGDKGTLVFLYPPGAVAARLVCPIQREMNFPRSLGDCVIVAEGTIGTDGRTLQDIKMVGGEWFDKLTWTPKTDSSGDSIEIQLSGEWNPSKVGPIADAEWGPFMAIFFEEDTISSGSLSIRGGHSSGRPDSMKKDVKITFRGRTEPGHKVRIGVSQPIPPEIVTFDFSLPPTR